MDKAEHNFKTIVYPAHGTQHRLWTIRGNKIHLTQNPSEWQQRLHLESVQTRFLFFNIKCDLHSVPSKIQISISI